MSTLNAKRRIVMPRNHVQFMDSFGSQSGLWEGWQDALADRPFRPEYDRATFNWQINYENGREFVVRLRAAKFKPNSWPDRHKPGPNLFRSAKPLFDGRA